MRRKIKKIYPIFKDELECIKEFKAFKKGGFYEVYGFGNSTDSKSEKHRAFYILDMRNPKTRFVVKKKTVHKLYDEGVLILLSPEKNL
jgi:hypothetical protein